MKKTAFGKEYIRMDPETYEKARMSNDLSFCKVFLTIKKKRITIMETITQKGVSFLKNRIKQLRQLKSITQNKLANDIGVSRQTIVSIENGKYTASLLLAHKIARYFDKYIEEVFIFE